MVGTILSDKLIKGGEELLKQLDSADVVVNAALWFYFSEADNWKLLISLPTLIPKGPKTAYREVQKALSRVGGEWALSLKDVAIAKPDAPLLRLLRFGVRTGHGINHIRFSRNVINGQLIEDAYIYRLT
jgi:hypothetical protein